MDPTGHVLRSAHGLYARADSNANTAGRPAVYKSIGIILAVCSGLFIGVSFVMKKKGLLKANAKYNEEAGEGYGYLKNAFWWTGMTLMIIGEICNFVAYAFVDAILVTPLGALSVVVTTILSAIFLKERLSFVGMVGCFNCIVGSVVIVVNAPTESSAATIQEMKHFVIAPGFLSYAGVVILGCAFVALWVAPRYGKKSMMVYLTICSLIGGLSVVATQGLGAAIVTQIGGTPQFNQWFLYVLLVFVVATLLTEIIYLNKALNLFNAALVTPTYYVYFTSSTIVTSAVLFRGFKGTPASIATVVMGFLQICAGVVLLQLSKSSKDVPDTAVFKGDLDQIRTIAEQEEPESEPRADTIRGSGALIRALSKRRSAREIEEVRAIHTDSMEPIAEDEVVEWDGLRRRKTVLDPGQTPIKRTKTMHPPLGMAQFPDDTLSDAGSDDIHPGFFPRFGRRSQRKSQSTVDARRTSPSPVAMEGLRSSSVRRDAPSTRSSQREHIFGLPLGLAKGPVDTSYHSPSAGGGNVHFDEDAPSERDRASSQGSSLAPPRPPPHAHGSRRQFSFQNALFPSSRRRSRSETSEADVHPTKTSSDAVRPTSRGALSFSGLKPGGGAAATAALAATEEERAGLVKGDSGESPYGALGDEQFEEIDEGDDEWSPVRERMDDHDHNSHYHQDSSAASQPLYTTPARRRTGDTGLDSLDASPVDMYGPPRRQQTGL